ncbi:MAG: phosphoribosylglycinamide synthetase C domain-containing protein, partial [Thermomicrobiales bacterium]
ASAIRPREGAAVCVTLAAAAYPTKTEAGAAITGVDEAQQGGALVFHAGTARVGQDLVTAGGRVLSVVGLGATVDDAIERAYHGADAISFRGKAMRRDIGVSQQRVPFA